MRRGFKRVRPLEGGFDAWLEGGYETHGPTGRTGTLPAIRVS
jgi:hypothetical protein